LDRGGSGHGAVGHAEIHPVGIYLTGPTDRVYNLGGLSVDGDPDRRIYQLAARPTETVGQDLRQE
jgi:hypothetical protein